VKAARQVRRELDLWKLVWQQIETFVDRVDGARDQDDPNRRKADALLRAAGVVERQRAVELGVPSLSDPVVDRLPARYWDAGTESTKPTSSLPGGGWARDLRRWRIPGNDELELAVGLLGTTGIEDDPPEALDVVVLPGPRDLFRRVEDGALATVRVPSYPGTIVGPGGELPDIEADPDGPDDRSSLFSKQRRFEATMDTTGENEPLSTWSALCARRRSGAGGSDVLHTGFDGRPPPQAGGLAGDALAIVADLRTGTAASVAAARLETLAASARAAAVAGSVDGQVLRDAADVLDDEGSRSESLPAALRAAADHLGTRPARLTELATAADALRANTSSGTARAGLEAAAGRLTASAALPPLLVAPVEAGPLTADLDDATGARVAYPDGTLRTVRTLEAGLAAAWGPWLRWLTIRYGTVLAPLLARFRAPFTAGARALVQGGPTGLACEGLEAGQDASVGADTVVTAQPSSLAATLDDLRPGHVGVVGGDRPTALVLVGLDEMAGQLALGVSPLRVSVSPEGPGRPGVLAAGSAIRCDAPGLSAGELERGESDEGPAADGLVHATVELWSRLRLVFGAATVEGDAGGEIVPDPSAARLEDLALFGQVPAMATVLVIAGAGDEYWDRTGEEPEPRLARTGEVLLLRGWADPEGDLPGATVQAAVEVDRVYRVTGSTLDRMDLSAAARLSTEPMEVDADGVPCMVCGPEEDVAVVLLRRSWMRRTLVRDVTLRRDFAGFDGPSLATERLLPVDVLTRVLGQPESVVVGVPGVDREDEFTAARETLKAWLRFGADA
jgi:hypothetical protein